ncbi:MAG: nucleoside monophosphate kinase [Bacteriovoracaceae bacterium]
MKKILILIGPPGSGKSTQAARVIDRYRLISISMGDLFRQEAEVDPTLAEKIGRGELISDQMATDLLVKALAAVPKEANIILDGYPRSKEQTKVLQAMLDRQKMQAKVVIIEVSEAEIMNRLKIRFICNRCKKVTNLEGMCDCGGQYLRRQDDSEETIKQRLSIYNKNLKNITDFFKAEKINGEGTFDEVTDRIYEKLDNYFEKP